MRKSHIMKNKSKRKTAFLINIFKILNSFIALEVSSGAGALIRLEL